jgi:hypothetical protein
MTSDANDPAPVITDRGSYGRLPPPPEEELSRFQGRTLSARITVAWVAGVAFAIAATLWLLALSAAQATDRQVAIPALERGIAAYTAIDDLLARYHDDLATGDATLPGFLVPGVALTPAEAQSGDVQLMREALLARAAEAVYEEGFAALEPAGAPVETQTFSTPGGARRVMDLLGASNHDRARALVWPLGIVTVALAAAVLALGAGFGRFSGLGLAMIGAAVLVMIAALLTKFVIAFIGSDGSAVADEFSRLIDTIAWTPAENAIAFGIAGAALLVPAWILGWIFDRSLVRPARVIDEG